MRSSLRTLTLVAAFSTAAAPASAQVAVNGLTRGWIGVSFEALTTDDGNGTLRTVVTVTDVIPGGPADEGGVRPGDVVLTVNGRDWQNRFGGIALQLRPGDPVRMVVERDGRRRELNVTAAARPTDVVVAPESWSVTFRADSMVDRMYRAMDSLRVRLIRDEDGTLTVLGQTARVDSLTASIRRIPGGSVRVRSAEPGQVVSVSPLVAGRPEPVSGVLPEVRPPFSFFLFR
ncbi:MAG TPA: PDZ domain-containing protein, partial [Longimicrobiales bacterium]|nr:PDZ domain-containing protein [Longimicrobiales bacterium]